MSEPNETEIETVEVPTAIYATIGLSALRLQREVQALWDACYLTHPNKAALLQTYLQRLEELNNGASPAVLETANYNVEPDAPLSPSKL